MPKTIKNCFYEKLTFEKLLQAHKRAKVHKTYKNEVIIFEMNLENNLTNLLKKLKTNQYHLGKYYTFVIYEPKERIIKALPYVDRIVHQWYIEEFIKPFIIPKFIESSFACLSERGTHRAVDDVAKNLKLYKRRYNYFWILKCDIKKFFYSIDPKILFKIMQKYITDKKLLQFTKLLIFENKDSSIGIPIGNYTSQFFANIYMNELDHYAKRVLKIECYTRYMDDFIILTKTKKECIFLKHKIEEFLKNTLRLELNDKSRYYCNSMGVNFCGYRIFPTHKLLRNNSKKKIKRNVKIWNKKFSKGSLNLTKTILRINSWIGHSSHSNTYNLQNKIINSCDFLFTNSTYQKIEKDMINLIESQNNSKKSI